MFPPRRLLIALVTVLVVAVAGCSEVTGTGDPTTAATVNGQAIAVDDLEGMMRLAQAGQTVDPPPEQLRAIHAQVVQFLVRLEFLTQGAADFGIEFTDEDLQLARATLFAQAGGEEEIMRQLEEVDLELSDLDAQLTSQSLELRISEHLADDVEVSEQDVQDAYDERFGELPEVRHILLESEEEAEDVIAELEDGADFNELATERSTDPSAQDNAGELGVVRRGDMVPEFEEAAFTATEGEIVGPVETNFGFHVLQVTAFEPQEDVPDLEDITDHLRRELVYQQGGQEAFNEWVAEFSAEAEVVVNPRFGEWQSEEGTVAPAAPLDGDDSESPDTP